MAKAGTVIRCHKCGEYYGTLVNINKDVKPKIPAVYEHKGSCPLVSRALIEARAKAKIDKTDLWDSRQKV